MTTPSLQLLTPEEIERRLADRVRAERLARNWRQSTLAARSGVSVPTIRRYEKTGRIGLHNLLLLLEALGRLDELRSLLEPPPAASFEALEARAAARANPRRRGTR